MNKTIIKINKTTIKNNKNKNQYKIDINISSL